SGLIAGLTPATTYHYQLIAANGAGLTNSPDASLTTAVAAPLVTTLAASGISATNATLNGGVNPNGATTTVAFCYGRSPSLTITTSSIPNPSFEASTFTAAPGYAYLNGGIPGWTYLDATRVGQNSAGGPFADNGAIPDGNNVGFVQSAGNE